LYCVLLIIYFDPDFRFSFHEKTILVMPRKSSMMLYDQFNFNDTIAVNEQTSILILLFSHVQIQKKS